MYKRYGAPEEVLRAVELPVPVPKSNELLIDVRATTVNRTDCGFLRGKPYIARLFSGLVKPRFEILGNEFAGVVEARGKDVTSFKPGDRVFGHSGVKFGAHARYMIAPENGPLAPMPEGASFEEAAPCTEGIYYALSDIRAAKIGGRSRVLINGATGAIGSAAVQLCKYLGAEVTAVCDTRNVELVRSLGADAVIDYKKEDFTRLDRRFDVIFDAVGKSSFGRCKPLLVKRGIYMSTDLGPGSQNPFLALITPLLGGKKVLFPIPNISQKDVRFFKELFESGSFKPVIDRYYTPEEMVAAFQYVETGQKTGNVVITAKSE